MTNLIKNAWYVAEWISALGSEPIRRRIIAEDVLLYRDESGDVIALSNLCPHRFAPLHKGKIVGDLIECPYHGLRFDRGGKCVYNPFTDGETGIPPNTKVHAYPVVEKYRFIWVWMGDPALADENDIPDYSFLDDTEGYTATKESTLEMPVNYMLILDNLMDLSHGQFLHPTTLANTSMAAGTTTSRVEGNYVFCDRWNPDGDMVPLFAATNLVPEGEHVDFWNDMWWGPASCYYLEVGITPTGRPREEGVFLKSAQLLTPIDENNTAYRYVLYRNFLKGNAEVTAGMEAVVAKAFNEEDRPILTEVHQGMAGRDFWSLRPAILEGDRAAILVRRFTQKLLKAEQEEIQS